MLDSEAAGNRADQNGEKDTDVCQYDGPVAPFVWEKFGKSKSSQLGVSTPL